MSTARLSGRHVTAIVSAICIAIVLAPVAVMATGSSSPIKVYLTDPHHSANKAAVSSSGALSVGGTVSVGNLPATQNVSGRVTTIPGLPGTPFHKQVVGTQFASFTVPTGVTLVIQSVSVQVGITAGDQVEAGLEYEAAPLTDAAFLYIPLSFAMTEAGSDTLVGTQNVNLYVASGSTVVLALGSPSSSASFGSTLEVSGYLT